MYVDLGLIEKIIINASCKKKKTEWSRIAIFYIRIAPYMAGYCELSLECATFFFFPFLLFFFPLLFFSTCPARTTRA